MVCLSAPTNFSVQRFHKLDSKDLGLRDLGMNIYILQRGGAVETGCSDLYDVIY